MKSNRMRVGSLVQDRSGRLLLVLENRAHSTIISAYLVNTAEFVDAFDRSLVACVIHF